MPRIDQSGTTRPAHEPSSGNGIRKASQLIPSKRTINTHLAVRGGVFGNDLFPVLTTSSDFMTAQKSAIEAAGLTPGEDAVISLDVAASEFGSSGSYHLSRDGRTLDTDELIELLGRWIERYPIAFVEDP